MLIQNNFLNEKKLNLYKKQLLNQKHYKFYHFYNFLYFQYQLIFLSSFSISKGPTFLKKGLFIKEYLSKLLKFSVSTNVTDYFLSTIVADH